MAGSLAPSRWRISSARLSQAFRYEDFKRIMEGRPGFVIAPWCGSEECERQIKAETQATLRNLPLNEPIPSASCLKCGKPAIASAYFAKAY